MFEAIRRILYRRQAIIISALGTTPTLFKYVWVSRIKEFSMKMQFCTWRHTSVAFFTAMLTATATTQATASAPYQFSFLNSLGGVGASAADINDLGQAVGYSSFALPSGQLGYSATMWSNGIATDLGMLDGFTSSRAAAINNLGQVAVNNKGYIDTDPINRGALWTAGSGMTMLPTPPFGYYSRLSSHWVSDINNSGTVAGVSKEWDLPSRYAEVNDQQITIWRDSMAIRLTVDPDRYRGNAFHMAHGINDSNVVVGRSNDNAPVFGLSQAAQWDGTTQAFLGPVPTVYDAIVSEAYAINDTGLVVGNAAYGRPDNPMWPGGFAAAVWNGGVQTLLPSLSSSASYSSALSVNNLGQIVGTSGLAYRDRRAVLWNNGVATDLNSFLDATSIGRGWVLQSANAINDNGWIVGDAYNTVTNQTEGFLLALSPVPEGNGLLLALAGLAVFAPALRRRYQVLGSSDGFSIDRSVVL
jgi:probable HAF family extracellular repeat protein